MMPVIDSDRSRPEFFPRWAATFENADEAEKAWERRVKKFGPDSIPRPNVNLPVWVYVQWSMSNSINDFSPSTTRRFSIHSAGCPKFSESGNSWENVWI